MILVFLGTLTSIEFINNDSENEIHGKESSNEHDENEKDYRDDTVSSIDKVVHEVDPRFEGEDLEDGQESLTNIVEARDTIHDQLNIANTIKLKRINAELS